MGIIRRALQIKKDRDLPNIIWDEAISVHNIGSPGGYIWQQDVFSISTPVPVNRKYDIKK